MAAADIQGSWFPTGYYGHFRSKSRADFVCEYRQLARPIPPKKFVHRAQEPTRRHVFSHHDNRQAFLNDALIFQQGLGRRRVPNSTYQFKTDFITWMPEKEFVERSRPLSSTYKQDFMPSQLKSQLFIQKPKTSFEGVPTTSYRYAHGSGAPNKQAIDAMNNEALKLSLLNRKDRAMSAVNRPRETVASCLTWSGARPKTAHPDTVRPSIPNATQMTEYTPQPPAAPKPQTVVASPTQSFQQAWPAPTAPPTMTNAPPSEHQAPVSQPQAPPIEACSAPPPPQPMAE